MNTIGMDFKRSRGLFISLNCCKGWAERVLRSLFTAKFPIQSRISIHISKIIHRYVCSLLARKPYNMIIGDDLRPLSFLPSRLFRRNLRLLQYVLLLWMIERIFPCRWCGRDYTCCHGVNIHIYMNAVQNRSLSQPKIFLKFKSCFFLQLWKCSK